MVVREEDGEVWLDFEDGAVQSRMLRADPARLVLEYTRLMMGFLLFVPAPVRIAMIGLGGGSLAKYCLMRLPDVDFTAVEISAEVVACRNAFGIPADGPAFRVLCGDGADFVRRDGDPLDVLLVDAFDSAGQPERLSSASFYDACSERLADGGMAVFNLYADHPSYEVHLARLRDAFDGRIVVVDVADTENELVFAGTTVTFPPERYVLIDRLRALQYAHPIDLDVALRKIVQYSDPRHARRRGRREALRRRSGATRP